MQIQHPFTAWFESHPARKFVQGEFVAELSAHPLYCRASRSSVQRWEVNFRCSAPSQVYAQVWNVYGIDVGLKQCRTLLTRSALFYLLVLRLMRFGGEFGVRYPQHCATCVMSRRHFLVSKNIAPYLFDEGRRLYRQLEFEKAANCWGQAVVLNHGPSHAFLSDMLLDDLLDKRSYPTIIQERLKYMERGTPASISAFKLASAGAALGCAHSKGALARCVFSTGSSEIALARESADFGSCFGQYVVGIHYKKIRQMDEAEHWLRLAAGQGHATAQFSLSTMFSLGDGVAKNRQEANRWRQEAAAQGHIGCKHKPKPKPGRKRSRNKR
jgi:hypothetical protein